MNTKRDSPKGSAPAPIRLTAFTRPPQVGDLLRSPAQVGAIDGYLFRCVAKGDTGARTSDDRMVYVRRADGGPVIVERKEG